MPVVNRPTNELSVTVSLTAGDAKLKRQRVSCCVVRFLHHNTTTKHRQLDGLLASSAKHFNDGDFLEVIIIKKTLGPDGMRDMRVSM